MAPVIFVRSEAQTALALPSSQKACLSDKSGFLASDLYLPTEPPIQKGPTLYLKLCCHCLEIVNNFQTRGPHFNFALDSCLNLFGLLWQNTIDLVAQKQRKRISHRSRGQKSEIRKVRALFWGGDLLYPYVVEGVRGLLGSLLQGH